MTTEKQFIQIEEYYRNLDTIKAMFPYTTNREIVFIPAKYETQNKPIRGIHAPTKDSLRFLALYLKYGLRQRPYNWYVSLAQFKGGLPKVSLSYANRYNKRNIIREWEIDLPDKIYNYTFVIDVDSPDHSRISIEASVESTINICRYLYETNETFFVVFSGMGFHIYIHDDQINQNYDAYKKPNIYETLTAKAQHLYDTFSEFVDVKIYDTRRVIKLPYSVAIYDTGLYFCKPMTSTEELKNFKLENYKFQLDNLHYGKPYIYNELKK